MKQVVSLARFLLQFAALAVFLRVAFAHGSPGPEDWLNAFAWGACAAVVQLLLFLLVLYRHQPLDRMVWAVNLYLILGGLAVATDQLIVLALLRDLKEAGIFVCLLVVGLVTTFASRAGFVGVVEGPDPRAVRRCSLGLVAMTCMALVVSFVFQGRMGFSAAAPLIVLGVATRLFRARLQRGAGVRADRGT